jgi:hypothetical protein
LVCPDPNCARQYGHLTGCRVVAKHKELDGYIAEHSVDRVFVGALVPNPVNESAAESGSVEFDWPRVPTEEPDPSIPKIEGGA